MNTVLVVDDDPAIREMVRLALERDGYAVQEAGNTLEAREQLAAGCTDIVLLDWMLPGQSGFEFIRSLHRDPAYNDIPVIMLTARDRESEKIAALERGADDYIAKPFSVRELLARIKAVLRRTAADHGEDILRNAGLELDQARHRVSAGGQPLELAPMEYQLLQFFMQHPERVYTRTQLIDKVWGNCADIEERTVDVHIRRLRKALEPHALENLIQTVRGVGYRFSVRPT